MLRFEGSMKKCVHYWVIDMHYVGRCRKCRKVKQFPWPPWERRDIERVALTIGKAQREGT